MNPDTIQKGYERYKKDWEQKQNEEFIAENKVHTKLFRTMHGLMKNTTLSYWIFSRNKGGNSPKRTMKNWWLGLRMVSMMPSILVLTIW